MRDPNPIVLLFAGITWILLWFWVISRIGYRGKVRLGITVLMCIPPINIITFMIMLILPFPLEREVKELRKRVALLDSDRR